MADLEADEGVGGACSILFGFKNNNINMLLNGQIFFVFFLKTTKY